MLEKEGDGVSSAVGMMAGVEAERDPGRIGLGEEGLDLVFILDVRFGMGMVDQLQAEPVSGQISHSVCGIDQAFPRIAFQPIGPGWLAGERVGISIVDQDEESPAEAPPRAHRRRSPVFRARARRPDLRGGPSRRRRSP